MNDATNFCDDVMKRVRLWRFDHAPLLSDAEAVARLADLGMSVYAVLHGSVPLAEAVKPPVKPPRPDGKSLRVFAVGFVAMGLLGFSILLLGLK